MKTRMCFKIIAFVLLQAFLLFDVCWAAPGASLALKSTLAPAVMINKSDLKTAVREGMQKNGEDSEEVFFGDEGRHEGGDGSASISLIPIPQEPTGSVNPTGAGNGTNIDSFLTPPPPNESFMQNLVDFMRSLIGGDDDQKDEEGYVKEYLAKLRCLNVTACKQPSREEMAIIKETLVSTKLSLILQNLGLVFIARKDAKLKDDGKPDKEVLLDFEKSPEGKDVIVFFNAFFKEPYTTREARLEQLVDNYRRQPVGNGEKVIFLDEHGSEATAAKIEFLNRTGLNEAEFGFLEEIRKIVFDSGNTEASRFFTRVEWTIADVTKGGNRARGIARVSGLSAPQMAVEIAVAALALGRSHDSILILMGQVLGFKGSMPGSIRDMLRKTIKYFADTQAVKKQDISSAATKITVQLREQGYRAVDVLEQERRVLWLRTHYARALNFSYKRDAKMVTEHFNDFLLPHELGHVQLWMILAYYLKFAAQVGTDVFLDMFMALAKGDFSRVFVGWGFKSLSDPKEFRYACDLIKTALWLYGFAPNEDGLYIGPGGIEWNETAANIYAFKFIVNREEKRQGKEGILVNKNAAEIAAVEVMAKGFNMALLLEPSQVELSKTIDSSIRYFHSYMSSWQKELFKKRVIELYNGSKGLRDDLQKFLMQRQETEQPHIMGKSPSPGLIVPMALRSDLKIYRNVRKNDGRPVNIFKDLVEGITMPEMSSYAEMPLTQDGRGSEKPVGKKVRSPFEKIVTLDEIDIYVEKRNVEKSKLVELINSAI